MTTTPLANLSRLIVPKRDFDAHIGKSTGIERLEADANTHRGPIPIRRGGRWR